MNLGIKLYSVSVACWSVKCMDKCINIPSLYGSYCVCWSAVSRWWIFTRKHEHDSDQVTSYLRSPHSRDDRTFHFKSRSSISSVRRIIEPLIHSRNRQIYVELGSRQQHRCGDGRVFCIQWRIDKAWGTLFLLFSWAKRTLLEARHQV